MRVLFFGTPEYAIPSLAQIAKCHDVVGVVCQDDKPVGRKRILTAPPTKLFALENNIPVLQPTKVSSINEDIIALNCEIFVVIAYGRIIPQSTLDLSPNPPINAHASLLPHLRGAAPAGRAIMNGDKETGVCVMEVVKALDAGPVMHTKRCPILPDENRFELLAKLSVLSAEALVEALDLIAEGKAVFADQDESKMTYAEKLNKEDGELDWNRPSNRVYDHIRGVSPVPGASSYLNITTTQKCTRVIIGEYTIDPALPAKKPGEVVKISDGVMWISTAEGCIGVSMAKPDGKPMLKVSDLINGYKVKVGDFFTRQMTEK